VSDISERVLDVRHAPVKKYIVFTADDVSAEDTITIDDLTTINLALVADRSAATEVTQTVATNVITIGGSYSDIDVVGLVIGV